MPRDENEASVLCFGCVVRGARPRVGTSRRFSRKDVSRIYECRFLCHRLDYLEEYDASRGISFGAHLVAGSLAGLAEHSLIFPLDTIKTNAQCVGACGPTKKPPDVLCVRAARDLLMEGAASGAGAMRLWRGVGVVTIACVPAHAAYFGLFETVRESARVRTATGSSSEHSAGALADGLAGALAAVGHDLIMTPADVVKQRLQLGHHSGIVDCLRTVWAAGGWRTLYRSLPTTLAMSLIQQDGRLFLSFSKRALFFRATHIPAARLFRCVALVSWREKSSPARGRLSLSLSLSLATILARFEAFPRRESLDFQEFTKRKGSSSSWENECETVLGPFFFKRRRAGTSPSAASRSWPTSGSRRS